MLAAVHVEPALSLPMAAAVAAFLVWYWIRLGRDNVPATRRRIRRISLVLMLVTLVTLLLGLSFIDPSTQQRQYIMTWTTAFIFIVIIMAIAAVDAVNTLRLARQQSHDALREAAAELSEAIRDRRRDQAAALHHPTRRNGEVTP